MLSFILALTLGAATLPADALTSDADSIAVARTERASRAERASPPTAPPDSLRVPILVYHNIQSSADARGVRGADLTMRPEVFAAQMQYLKEHGIPVVSFTALVEALEGKRTLPPKAVVITFDDGRLNQYTNAIPVLKKLGFTATFFPFTHAMDRNPRYFSWAQLQGVAAGGPHHRFAHLAARARGQDEGRQADAHRGHGEPRAAAGEAGRHGHRVLLVPVRRPCGCRRLGRARRRLPRRPCLHRRALEQHPRSLAPQGRPNDREHEALRAGRGSVGGRRAPGHGQAVAQARGGQGRPREAAAGTLGTQNPPPERPAGGRMR
ncbi:MAG: polysaccharide deacetylase family protein [Gemmatimonadetes bacterium]|nr:polysaccharide deacetylase family protein [Gemmatimonadota bacterium]